jgi:hypothetical protein
MCVCRVVSCVGWLCCAVLACPPANLADRALLLLLLAAVPVHSQHIQPQAMDTSDVAAPAAPVPVEETKEDQSNGAPAAAASAAPAAGLTTLDVPPNQTLYLNNINEKIKMVGTHSSTCSTRVNPAITAPTPGPLAAFSAAVRAASTSERQQRPLRLRANLHALCTVQTCEMRLH